MCVCVDEMKYEVAWMAMPGHHRLAELDGVKDMHVCVCVCVCVLKIKSETTHPCPVYIYVCVYVCACVCVEDQE